MKKTFIIILFLLGLLTLTTCHKDKEIEAKAPVVSNEEMTVTETQATISWTVDFTGWFSTGVDVSSHENMSEARRVEASKVDGKYVAVVDGLTTGTKYYYRIVVWNKYGSFEEEESEFVTEEKIFYQVKATCSPADGGRVTGAGSFEENRYCTLNAISSQGYDFVNWTESGNPVSSNASYTFKVTQNRNLVAHFAKQKFTVSVSATPSAGGSVTGGGQYDYGQSCTVSATAASGYTFSKWAENGTQVSTNANYTFTVTENRTLVAHFTELQGNEYNVNVSASPSEGGTVTGGGVFQSGSSCTVTATANTGYTFANWTENGSVVSSSASYTFTVNANRTLVANFTAQSYTISVSANPSAGGSVSGGGEYHYGDNCTVRATANSGFNFINWTENGSQVSTEAEYSFVVNGDRTLVAHFATQAPNEYTITVTADPTNGGTVSGGGTYQQGQSCTVTASANTGYTFTNWTENGNVVSSNASYTFTVTANRSLVAHFSTQSCAISVSANPTNGGTVSGGGAYNYGQSCTVHATANSGYLFTKWTENGTQVSTDANYTFTVTGDRNLVAHFTVCYTITVSANPSNGGTVSGGGSYSNGQGCVVRAVANSGYTFTNWTENGNVVSTDPDYGFIVTRDRTLVAHFTVNTQNYTISVSANPSNGGSASGGGTYQQGQSCTVHATANTNYSFTNWTENGTQVSTNANYTFTVTSNRNLVANFAYSPQTPTGAIDGLFSISATQQVYFSQGNLQYQASSNSWRFATNQYDYIGSANSNISSSYSGWIDLFGWGTSGWNCGNTYYRPWDSNNSDGSLYGPPNQNNMTGSYANSDWGVYNAVSNGGNQSNLWRVLTSAEWDYVFNTRVTNSGKRFAKAKVNGVNGMILLPDNWNTNYYSLSGVNNGSAHYTINVIDASTWTSAFEANGAVFLPASGRRVETAIYEINSYGNYWSSTSYNSADSYGAYFSDDFFDAGNDVLSYTKWCGMSVRLVCPAQ